MLFRVVFRHILAVSEDEDVTASLIQSLAYSTVKFFFLTPNEFPLLQPMPMASYPDNIHFWCCDFTNLVQYGISIPRGALLSHVQLNVHKVFICEAAFYPVNP